MPTRCTLRVFALFAVLSLVAGRAGAQLAPKANAAESNATAQQLQDEINELRQLVIGLNAETKQYREEVLQLQEELRAQAHAQLATAREKTSADTPDVAQNGAAPAVTPDETPASAQRPAARTAQLEDDVRLLSSKVDDQYQTKIESGSK